MQAIRSRRPAARVHIRRDGLGLQQLAPSTRRRDVVGVDDAFSRKEECQSRRRGPDFPFSVKKFF